MAIKKLRKHRLNADGEYDVLHYETEADLVLMEDGSTVAESFDSLTPCITRVVLIASNWNSNTFSQTVTVIGIKADETTQVITVSPYNKANHELVSEYGIYCLSQGENSLTFTCDTVPTTDIAMAVVWQRANYQ